MHEIKYLDEATDNFLELLDLYLLCDLNCKLNPERY